MQRYDCSAGNFEVYYAGAFPPDEFNTMEPDVGYWINMIQAATLTLSGTPLTEMRSVPLCAGFNLIGWSSPNTTLVETGTQSIDGEFSTVQRYNCTSGNFEVYYAGPFPPDQFTNFEPGKGYWINATTATTWTYNPAARIILRQHTKIGSKNR